MQPILPSGNHVAKVRGSSFARRRLKAKVIGRLYRSIQLYSIHDAYPITVKKKALVAPVNQMGSISLRRRAKYAHCAVSEIAVRKYNN